METQEGCELCQSLENSRFLCKEASPSLSKRWPQHTGAGPSGGSLLLCVENYWDVMQTKRCQQCSESLQWISVTKSVWVGFSFSLYKHRFLRQEETAWVRHSSNQHEKETFLMTDLSFIKPESFNSCFCFFLKDLGNTCSSFLGKSLSLEGKPGG